LKYLEMLAQLGISSAHPGGFTATLRKLEHFHIPKHYKILEVGCGTGRTTCHMAKEGYDIVGLDNSSDMLAKANHRAQMEGLSVDFAIGDIHEMPYHDQQFDIILAESVTNFGRMQQVLAEYNRVLKPGGMLYDREVILGKALDVDKEKLLLDFFGAPQLLTVEDWQRSLEEAEFKDVSFWDYRMLDDSLARDHYHHPDPLQYTSEGAYSNLELWETIAKYNELIESCKDALGSIVITAVKQPASP
jgi:ubiquinone/menaquinone biosynthesis C-methylase UbiE